MKRSCGACDFFEESEKYGGQCRYDPPSRVDGHMFGVWPSTQQSAWCGRFVPKNSTATQAVVGQPYIKE